MALSCAQTQDRLVDWLNEELPDAEGRAIEEHMATCEFCQEACTEVQWVIRQLRSLEEPIPPVGLVRTVRQRIEADLERTHPVWSGWLDAIRHMGRLHRLVLRRALPITLAIVLAAVGLKTFLWPAPQSPLPQQSLAFRAHTGAKRVMLGQVKRASLQLNQSQEFPGAITDIWGQPVVPDLWTPADQSSSEPTDIY